jgi:hypothetical protein
MLTMLLPPVPESWSIPDVPGMVGWRNVGKCLEIRDDESIVVVSRGNEKKRAKTRNGSWLPIRIIRLSELVGRGIISHSI